MKSSTTLQKFTVNVAVTTAIIMMAVGPFLLHAPNHNAYAHFLGVVKKADNYQVAFQPTPLLFKAGENTSLHFSVYKDSANVANVNAALQIKEKDSNKIVEQLPYKLYEIGDMSIPYTFKNNTDYSIALLMRVNDGNPSHSSQPLTASFDVAVQDRPVVSPNELIAGAGPYTAAMVAGVFLVFKKVR